MSEEEERKLAWRKVETAQKELADYLVGAEHDPTRHAQLAAAVTAARKELMDLFTSIPDALRKPVRP